MNIRKSKLALLLFATSFSLSNVASAADASQMDAVSLLGLLNDAHQQCEEEHPNPDAKGWSAKMALGAYMLIQRQHSPLPQSMEQVLQTQQSQIEYFEDRVAKSTEDADKEKYGIVVEITQCVRAKLQEAAQ